MELVKLTHENMEKEHICCAISNNKDIQVMSKKNWLKDRLDEGLVFLKGNVRGKCFIEYIPAEYAWAPIEAEGYMYIDCLWVSGQFKGHGYSNLLLDACIKDSKEKGKKGLVILSSKKKMNLRLKQSSGMAESMSAALKLMENRRIFTGSPCRNSHTGTTDTAELQAAWGKNDRIKKRKRGAFIPSRGMG